ncbi:STAS/SEC14 domain-containing protein [candidate division WOR-3 bacterium]|nr:STAS/SEC14 domain-containing protein [candidate division WOR-3 bacterium]
MKHKVYYDEENEVVAMDVLGEFSFEEAQETMKLMRESFADKAPYPFLLDLEALNSDLDRNTRKHLQTEAGNVGIARMAMVVSNPMMRMTAKIVSSVIGKKNETGFFKTREEALHWLKGNTRR